MTQNVKPLSAVSSLPEIEESPEQSHAMDRATEFAHSTVRSWLETDHESDYRRESARLGAVAVLSGTLDGCPYDNFDKIKSDLEASAEVEPDHASIDTVNVGVVAVSSMNSTQKLQAAVAI